MTRSGGIAILLALLWTACAGAQQEQFLQYRTGYPGWYMPRANLGIELSPTPRAGLELPAGVDAASALFGEGKLGSTSFDVILILAPAKPAASQPAGGDKLYIDTNLDGKLADEKPIISDSTQNTGGDYRYGFFKNVGMKVPTKEGPSRYDLQAQYTIGPRQNQLSLRPQCFYEGPVTIGGKRFTCRLADGDANGLYNDLCNIAPDDSAAMGPFARQGLRGDFIRLTTGPDSDGSSTFSPDVRMVGRYIQANGALYALEVASDGATVKFTPADSVATGTVQGPEETVITVAGPEGTFTGGKPGEVFTVPVGRYHLLSATKTRKDDQSHTWQIQIYDPSSPQMLEVKAGETAQVKPPSGRFELTAYRSQPGQVEIRFAMQVDGNGMASYLRDGQTAPGPIMHITNAEGTYHTTHQLGFG